MVLSSIGAYILARETLLQAIIMRQCDVTSACTRCQGAQGGEKFVLSVGKVKGTCLVN